VESILSYSPPPPAGVDPQLVRDKPFENLSNTRIEFYVKGRLYKAKGLTPAQLAGR